MVTSSDIYCSRSGVLLLKKGTVFHQAVINYLQNMDPEAVIYIEEGLDDTTNMTGSPREKFDPFYCDEKKELEGSIGQIHTIPSEVADEETKKIYIQAYKTINEIYKNRKIKPYIKEIFEVLDYLVKKLSVNPEMMLQVALLKKIENYCLSHSINVCVFAAYLGKLLGMDIVTLKELSLAGIMHDIGKLDISPEILRKKGLLTDKEFESIKLHSLHSFIRLASVENVGKDVLNGVLQHHERSDGSGYLHGLKGNDIHLWGRILGIVDVFDAVTSERSYRNSVSQHEGLEMLLSNSFQFDQNLLSLFIKNISFYPIGSRVLLNTGETGIVTGIHRHIPFRPIVKIQNKNKSGERVVDLSEQLTLFIEKIILD
jgi:HD-GYP domain-containing protein (c-di-GMP phosphodiesterase class II)